jgi:prevent-host-death family protein
MKTITATHARRRLYSLLDEVTVSSEPVQITGKRGSAVLVSEADWRALAETVYLSSMPEVAASIREGLEASLDDCVEELDW